ncbi:MAG: hypothetical protein HFJ54_01730 [Clostridia bacterium]|nr:hypothetical protein [Clostridia bacterium]
MGKKKKVTKKKKSKQDAYIHAITVMILSALLAVFIYIKSGYIGEHLSPMLGGIMGWIKYLVPLGTFLIGISLVKEKKEFVAPKITQYAIIILCICAFMSLMQMSGDNKKIDVNDEFSNIVSKAYDLGTENKGGGVIGALVAVPMRKLLRTSWSKCSFTWCCNTTYNLYIWNKTSRISR